MENKKVFLDIPEDEINIVEAYFDQVTVNMKRGKVYTQADLILIADDMNVCRYAKMHLVFTLGSWIADNCHIADETSS